MKACLDSLLKAVGCILTYGILARDVVSLEKNYTPQKTRDDQTAL
jgi:hypothetical protein